MLPIVHLQRTTPPLPHPQSKFMSKWNLIQPLQREIYRTPTFLSQIFLSGANLFGHVSHFIEFVRVCLACQHFDFNSADWFSDNLDVSSSWYLRTTGKELNHSFQQTLVGQEHVTNPYDRLHVRLITCKTCGPQYVESTETKFRMKFNNHKTGIKHHGNLDHVQRDQDDLMYKHFWGGGTSRMGGYPILYCQS